MTASAIRPPSVSNDPVLNNLIDEVTAKLQAGESIDIEMLAAQHPDHADALRRLVPALHVLADLSNSIGKASDSSFIPHPSSFPDGTLGDFRLIREVGRGGMGIVYEAEQISLRRHVALKVLPFAGTLDPRHLQRFKNEAQAAAHLHHTNIVPVYFVGSERGVHFYAMQFIEGQTLADVIGEIREEKKLNHRGAEDTEKKDRTGPQSSLCSLCLCGKYSSFFRYIAELGIQAAEALDHAHEQGIVHRDIKPANLLLTSFPSPLAGEGKGGGTSAGHLWITDFGLAHFQTDAALTMSGDLIGTLRYMSPEQALAKRVPIDHRTDIYSLGATLYELLTLHPVIDGQDRAEILRKLTLEEPTPLRKWNKSIPPELETIVLKALEKLPESRYATAKELADDLRRWMLHEPIKAKPPGWRERAIKWGRRHRVLMQAALAVSLLAAGGFALSTWFVWRERQKSVEEAEVASAMNEFLIEDLLNQTSPYGQLSHGFDPNFDITMKEVLDRAASRIDQRFKDRPRLVAVLHRTIGIAYVGIGEVDKGLDHLVIAQQLCAKSLGETHLESLKTTRLLAVTYMHSDHLNEAAELFEQTLPYHRAALGPFDRDTFEIMRLLAGAYRRLGRHREAHKLRTETLELMKTHLGPNDPFTLNCLMGLASDYESLSRHGAALLIQEDVIAKKKTFLALDDIGLLNDFTDLAVSFAGLGRHEDALRLNKQTHARLQLTVGPDSPWTFWVACNLAANLAALGRDAEAAQFVERNRTPYTARYLHVDFFETAIHLRLEFFEKRADAVRCRTTAELWESFDRRDAKSLLRRAACRARCAAIATRTAKTESEVDAAINDANRAMEWLCEALACGASPDQINANKDFDVMRRRKDYQTRIAGATVKQN